MYWASKKKLEPLARCGIQSKWSIFKTEMFNCPSKAKSVLRILFSEITHLLDPKVRNGGKEFVWKR